MLTLTSCVTEENHTIGRRVDNLLSMWRGIDPASVRLAEGASL